MALAVAGLLLTLGAGMALGAPASASTAIISWSAGMTPSGASHPEGPVGMRATVHGTGFPAGESVRLGLVAGNTNADPDLCDGTSIHVGDVTASESGSFYAAFYWPASAGNVGTAYSICGYAASTGAVSSTHDSGTFTVLADSAPILILSARSARAGQTITVSGRHWLPPQPVTITIRSGSAAPLVTAHAVSSGQSTGTFSTVVTLPANMPSGSYTVGVSAENGTLGASAPGALGVSGATPAAPQPTATASTASNSGATPGVTAGATPPATGHSSTSAGGGTSTGSTGHGTATVTTSATASSGTVWAVVGLAITVALLLGIIGVLLYLLWRRQRAEQAEVERERAVEDGRREARSQSAASPQPTAAPQAWPGRPTGGARQPLPVAPAPAYQASAYQERGEDWQRYAPAPPVPAEVPQPLTPLPPATAEPWPDYAPMPPAQEQHEHGDALPSAPVAAGLEQLQEQPALSGEQDPRTWVWGQDLPRGPYALSPAGVGAPPAAAYDEQGEPYARSSAPAQDALALPGPWRLDPTSVPADLTLPALRGQPPGPGPWVERAGEQQTEEPGPTASSTAAPPIG